MAGGITVISYLNCCAAGLDIRKARLIRETDSGIQGRITAHGKGILFIAFVAPALRMKLRCLMKESWWQKKYTREQIRSFAEPGKLHQVGLTDGKPVVTEISERQREIPEAPEVNPHPAGVMFES